MKNVLFGLTVGVVIGYALRRMEDQGQFDALGDKLGQFADKAKKKVKNVVDTGKNQVEYAKDRIESYADDKFGDNKFGDNKYGDNKLSDNKLGDNKLGDNKSFNDKKTI